MSRPRFTSLLAATLLGVYLLVVVGATASLADAVAACGTWPTCSGSLTDPQVAVATGHRIVAVVVGLLGLATAVVGWSVATTRVRLALAVAGVAYPIQAGVGAFVALEGAPRALAGTHLFVGTVIFTALALALAWQLEAETGTDDTPDGSLGTPDPALDDIDDAPADSPTTPLTADVGPLARTKRVVWAYFQLMKPRLMWLLCLVASAGMALAAGSGLALDTVLFTLLGGVLSIGASGTFNHVLERDVDKKMQRTSDRPLAKHEVPVRNALAFAAVLTVLSLVAFLQVNVLVATLGFVAILFYSVVYTLILKPNTVQNTVIGGAAGALPALIGYVAVTGWVGLDGLGRLLPGLVLAGVIFLWTPAHFYNLALAYKDDYARGGFPMMPVVRGETVTRKHILWYLAATLVAATGLTALTGLGWLYATATVVFGGVFLWAVVLLHREQTESAAFRAFHASNAYLGTVLIAVVLDAIVV